MAYDPKTTDRELERFNDWSKSYDQSVLQKIYFGRVQRAVIDLVPASLTPAAVLDVGCGTGRLLRRAGKRWPAARLVGVDASAGMIEAARRLDARPEFHASPAESLPLPAASVDVVFSTISFHHWTDKRAGLREAARVLKPCGRLVLADENLPGWANRLFHSRRSGHPVPDKPAALRSFLREAGFQILKSKRIVYGTVVVFLAALKDSADAVRFE
jgi:ubiquinone/menaquinone biosynthesis C-methylase UbiE